jgi:mannose-1-phosphate guanylyltransferase
MEETILGTGGGIRHAADTLRGSGTILIRNSDFLLDVDLKQVLEFHKASERPVTLVLAEGHDLYTPVPVGADDQILSFGDLATYDHAEVRKQGVFTGLHLIEEEVLDLIPGPGPCDIIRDVYLPMLQDGKVGACFTERFWWEFGTPERYLEGSLQLLGIPAREAQRFCRTDPVQDFKGARVALGPGAQLGSGTRCHGGVAVGHSAAVGKQCDLHDSMILPEAWIGPEVSLSRCIVGVKTEIPAGTRLSDCLVCADSSPGKPVPEGCRRKNGLIWRTLTRSDGQ